MRRFNSYCDLNHQLREIICSINDFKTNYAYSSGCLPQSVNISSFILFLFGGLRRAFDQTEIRECARWYLAIHSKIQERASQGQITGIQAITLQTSFLLTTLIQVCHDYKVSAKLISTTFSEFIIAQRAATQRDQPLFRIHIISGTYATPSYSEKCSLA